MGPRLFSLASLAIVALPALASARVVPVTTAAELIAAIDDAMAGDEIVLANGTYALSGATCDAVGTEALPIVVRAAEPLGAKLELDGVEGFRVVGAHWRFEGLDVRGVCAVDASCEHAFHVTGAAHGFVLRGARVMDFNAQLKVNASMIGGVYVAPDRGLVEASEIGDTRGRATSNPVTKLNIDTGDDWIVRGNYLHDAHKLEGNQISYAAFLKSGGKRGLVERNLVICAKDVPTGGTRIGLSLGGGGTAPQFCAPAYDAAVPCSVEHDGGTIRNNIVVNCSDVGIYLNRARNAHVLYNTLIGTTGVDFRFDTTSGEAVGNLLTGVIRTRDGATMAATDNQQSVAVATFAGWYRAPLAGDLAVVGDVSALVGAGPARGDVPDDYCGAARPAGPFTLGAIEHALAGCDTTRPPDVGGGGGGGAPDAGPLGDGGMVDDAGSPGGCCEAGADGAGWPILVVAVVIGVRRRRRGRLDPPAV